MRDVMVDLETRGNGPGCVILSIGAVEFSPQGLGKEFYCVVNTADCKKHGLKDSVSTMQWWDKQSDAAREVIDLAASKKTSIPLKLALSQFTEFLLSCNELGTIRIHGNGASFDNAILAVAYRAIGFDETPWKFWNDRCHRTNKAKAPKSSEPKREGTYHNALDDAKHQARHAIELSRGHGVRVFA